MKTYKIIKNALAYLDCKLVSRILDKNAKKICKAHPEWNDLNKNEKKTITSRRYMSSRGGLPSYKMYKNVTGVNGEELKLFVPESFYRSQVLVRTNQLNHCISGRNYHSLFEDKCYLDKVMPGIRTPETVVKKICNIFYDSDYNILSEEEALKKMRDYDRLVFKISKGSGHGRGVRVARATEFRTMLTDYGSDFVVQPVMEQAEELAYFNESSVNCLRVTSLVLKGNVYILGAIFRIGAPGAFCDHEAVNNVGFLSIGLDADGNYGKKAYDSYKGIVYDDVYGKPIPDTTFPKYDEIKQLVCEYHKGFPDYGIIGWDFTIDINGNIVCFEINTRNPAIQGMQCCLGPIFGKKDCDGNVVIDEILKITINKRSRPTI